MHGHCLRGDGYSPLAAEVEVDSIPELLDEIARLRGMLIEAEAP